MFYVAQVKFSEGFGVNRTYYFGTKQGGWSPAASECKGYKSEKTAQTRLQAIAKDWGLSADQLTIVRQGS